MTNVGNDENGQKQRKTAKTAKLRILFRSTSSNHRFKDISHSLKIDLDNTQKYKYSKHKLLKTHETQIIRRETGSLFIFVHGFVNKLS